MLTDGDDVHPVGRDNRQRASGGTEIEIGRVASVDDSEADGLARTSGDVLARAAVGQEGVVGDVGNVHRRQPGFFPLQIVRDVTGPERAEERLRGALADRIPIAAAQESAENGARPFVGPVGKHDDFLAVDGRKIGARGHRCLGLEFERDPYRLALAATCVACDGERSGGEQRGGGEELVEAIHGANPCYFPPAAASSARYFAGSFSNFLMHALQHNMTVRSGCPACVLTYATGLPILPNFPPETTQVFSG